LVDTSGELLLQLLLLHLTTKCRVTSSLLFSSP
jgi:hypothetical protein